ncbi:DUF6226 family protein [Agromyces marinus]|uniref:Uncharacterized protein n=1 Tax=Agromyces marinus TaxID=1389020 RepID=A0ABM8GY64_9MICO|nr:DUF6226 family protein [Agromyces marinus]UIP58317.1 hypothetical protein DSM26151_11880 [Agromyces marinus]BDZ53435.1 hypothetical protein GCM10025870_05080 [Agromyces marinus]
MPDYVRPVLPGRVFVDEHGAPIEYGRRWGDDSPPDEAYSRTGNLERFAGLHTVALALIEWLRASFDVEVDEGADAEADLLLQPTDMVRAVRLTPASAQCAPLTFVLTGFPGVFLHAGMLHDFHFPACGCDACDEDPSALVDDFEWTVRMVVAGHYHETAGSPRGGWHGFRLDEPGVGSRAGQGQTIELPPGVLEAALERMPAGGRWRAWPERTESAPGG